MAAILHSDPALKRRRMLALACCVLLGASGLPAQTAPVPEKPTVPLIMKTFVLIFRQSPARPISADERQQLATEMRPWAQRQNDAGRKLVPHILAPESAHLGTEVAAAIPPGAWPVTALLFVEATDLGEATGIAGSHPGLKYRAVVEVRAWAPPGPPVPAVAPTGL